MAGLMKSRLKLKRRSWDVLTYRILEENGRLNGSCLTEMRFTNSWIYEYKNIQESTPSYPRTVFPQVNDKGTPDSLHALNGVFLQNNKPFSLHATLCLLFFFRTPL